MQSTRSGNATVLRRIPVTDDNICYCGNYGGGKHTRSARCPGGEALSSNPRSMSGPEAKRAVEEAPRRLRQTLAEIERLRAVLADVAKRLKTGYEPGCDCGGCRTMRYAEKALIGVAVETKEHRTDT